MSLLNPIQYLSELEAGIVSIYYDFLLMGYTGYILDRQICNLHVYAIAFFANLVSFLLRYICIIKIKIIANQNINVLDEKTNTVILHMLLPKIKYPHIHLPSCFEPIICIFRIITIYCLRHKSTKIWMHHQRWQFIKIDGFHAGGRAVHFQSGQMKRVLPAWTSSANRKQPKGLSGESFPLAIRTLLELNLGNIVNSVRFHRCYTN